MPARRKRGSWQVILFEPFWIRTSIILTTFVLYAFLFSHFENVFGPTTVVISIIPVALVGWFFGTWAGLIAGILTFPINLLLLERVLENGPETMIGYGIPGTITAIIVGALIGKLGDLSEKFKKELFEHKQAKKKLSQDSRGLEDQLKEERDTIKQIVSSMGEGLLVIDKKLKITMINPAAERLLEVKTKDVVGREWSGLVSTLKGDEKTPKAERSFSQAVNKGKTIITTLGDNHYYLTKSGRKFPVVSTTAPIKEGKKVIGAVKAFRDATSEKELEEQLRKERDRFNLIIASMGEGLLVIDKDYKITLINPTAAKLLETSVSAAIGKNWSDIIKAYKKDSEIPFEKRVSVRVLKMGRTIVTRIEDDHYYVSKSSKKFSVASITAPLFDEEKNIIGAVKVFRDAMAEKEAKSIIEQKVEERTRELRKAKDKISEGWLQLQREKARLTASINSLPLGFFIISKEHDIVYMNSAMKSLLGHSSKKWTFKSLSEHFRKHDISIEDFCAHCRDEVSAYGIDDVPFADKILRLISVPITMPENREAIGSAVVVEDVTEEKLLDRTKDEFLAVASHELRTPLTAIRGSTSLIMNNFADKVTDEDFKEILSDMHQSSIRLIDIVNDFLDVSRLEQGRIEFRGEKVNVIDIINESIEEYKVKAEEKGLALKFNPLDDEIPNALADKNRAKQVLVNLIGNAINFTEKGSITVAVEKDTDFLKIRVSDTGVGITSKNKKLLFKKFQQAGERVLARDVTRGTGMGLYISKLLVEGMAGKIYLEKSKVGKGSTFVFTLPIAKD